MVDVSVPVLVAPILEMLLIPLGGVSVGAWFRRGYVGCVCRGWWGAFVDSVYCLVVGAFDCAWPLVIGSVVASKEVKEVAFESRWADGSA